MRSWFGPTVSLWHSVSVGESGGDENDPFGSFGHQEESFPEARNDFRKLQFLWNSITAGDEFLPFWKSSAVGDREVALLKRLNGNGTASTGFEDAVL